MIKGCACNHNIPLCGVPLCGGAAVQLFDDSAVPLCACPAVQLCGGPSVPMCGGPVVQKPVS